MLFISLVSVLVACQNSKCDAICETTTHVAKGNFAEINKIIWKCLDILIFYINFDNT